ncbi:MAG: hypothetical protein HY808_02140 [Nitrospirae bacterium]|nr:hypothetical protein [Nitrospirota bacterium]
MAVNITACTHCVQHPAAIKVAVNDDEKLKIIPEREFVCFSSPLTPGINRINITAVKDNITVGSITIEVFRSSELQSVFKDPPAGFQKDYFHMKDHGQCKGCHKLEPGDADRKPVNISGFRAEGLKDNNMFAGSTCYSCHNGLTSSPFVHGPAAVWSCLSCHEAESKPVYSVKKPDTKICFGCHVEQKEDWYSKKYFHGPFSVGKCAICHNPHSSENPFNLIKPAWELCLSCHPDKGGGEHIIAGYFFNITYHPTHGKPDPLRKGQELSCSSCHNPHASNSQKLWRLNVGSGFELCRKCHTD